MYIYKLYVYAYTHAHTISRLMCIHTSTLSGCRGAQVNMQRTITFCFSLWTSTNCKYQTTHKTSNRSVGSHERLEKNKRRSTPFVTALNIKQRMAHFRTIFADKPHIHSHL